MARFLVASESESEELNEEEEELNQPVQAESSKTQSKAKSRIDLSWKAETKTKHRMVSEKTKRWNELRNVFNELFDKIALHDYKAAYASFQKLQKTYARAEKAIEQNGHPNFFITNMKELTDKITELVATEKEVRRFAFSQELETFSTPFAELIKECRENPDDFPDDDAEEEESNEAEDDESSGDEGGGGWFISAEPEVKTEKQSSKQAPRANKAKREMSANEAALARLEEMESRGITNESARAELDKYQAARLKGKIIATTTRLQELMDAGLEDKLDKEVQVEIVHTLTDANTDRPIPIDDWNLALTILKDMKGHEMIIVPLLERLDKDFWARSVDPKHLFTQEVTSLHGLQHPSYIPLLKQYSKDLFDLAVASEKKGDKEGACREYMLFVRVELLVLKHVYHPSGKADDDSRSKADKAYVLDMVPKILSVLSKHFVFDEEVSLRYKIRVSLFLVTSLAVRCASEADLKGAVEIMKRLPVIPEKMPLERILYNRARVYIGMAAFRFADYRLCYESMHQFSPDVDAFKISMLLGQAGRDRCVYPPWMYLDPRAIVVYIYLSAIILDLPSHVSMAGEGHAIVDKHHRSLLRARVYGEPEEIEQRMAVCVAHAKIGEWQKATETIESAVLNRYLQPEEAERFKSDLRKMSLCCFLLTAHTFYDTISYGFLAEKFELQEDEAKQIALGILKDKHAPVANVSAVFSGVVDEDGKFLSFGTPALPSSFADQEKELDRIVESLHSAVMGLA